MTRVLIIVLALSILGNLAGLYILKKAFLFRSLYLGLLDDYGQVSFYRDENAKLVEHRPEEAQAIRSVVFYGASITQAWDLAEAFPELRAINRGLHGQFTSQMLARVRHDALDLSPRAVVIKACAINARSGIDPEVPVAHMAMMAQLATANWIEPILATVIPVSSDHPEKGEMMDKLARMNEGIRGLCEKSGYRLIDFAAALSDEDGFLRSELALDELHPNEAGYEVMTKAARPVLEEALK